MEKVILNWDIRKANDLVAILNEIHDKILGKSKKPYVERIRETYMDEKGFWCVR